MNKLWGGRFRKKTNTLLEEFSNSIRFDHKLAKYDCIGSLYHIDVLKEAKLLSGAEHSRLRKGLNEILFSIEQRRFVVESSFEDIHSYIQFLLEKKAGKAALKLHTCRSRNDQIVFDTKFYCLDQLTQTSIFLDKLTQSLTKLALKNKDIFIPGYTHLQHAIPVSLVEYFFAYIRMFNRDAVRLIDATEHIDLTMGSGALAGTFIHRSKYNRAAKNILPKDMKAPVSSVDTVSDRDFIIESLSVLSIIAMHLSRLSEDMILWASKEFDFIDIDESFCTGSSLMPQKKNPDAFELVRGSTGRVYGNLVNVLVMMKGLPLSYNRDMQHDKEPMFDSFETIQKELELFTELFKNIKFNKHNIEKQLDDECLYATDIADYLVQSGVPFKESHALIGKLIQLKFEKGIDLRAMDSITLQKVHSLLTPQILKSIINPKQSVQSKRSVNRRYRSRK